MTDMLTKAETTRLDELEAVIDRGIKTFAQVGSALLAIRDARLYRDEFDTFEAYCKERWGFTANRARRLIGAAEVAGNLENVPIGTIPTNEAQARPLAKLLPEQQPEAWQAATEKAATEGRKVTARDVEREVAERITETKTEEQKEVEAEEDGDQRTPIAAMGIAKKACFILTGIGIRSEGRKDAFDYVIQFCKKEKARKERREKK